MRTVLFATLLLAVGALPGPASSQAGLCATLAFADQPLPNNRLMPENGTFSSTVTYALSPTGTSCVPRPCNTPSNDITFRVKTAPPYAKAAFNPTTAQLSTQGSGASARSVLTITTNRSAPAFKDDAYLVEVRGCPHPEVEATKTIKNDYWPGLNATVGNGTTPANDGAGIPQAAVPLVAAGIAVAFWTSSRRRR